MTHINQLMHAGVRERMIREGFVRYRDHATEPLRLFGYTEKAQFSREWNDVTKQCRGLVINRDTGEVVFRPIPKFFAWDDPMAGDVDLDAPVEVSDKLDGSLGLLITMQDGSHTIATRGSFESEQAKWATDLYQRQYAGKWKPNPDVSYHVEIIAPFNRIVVNYQDQEDLVLIATVDNKTGQIYSPQASWNWPGPRVKKFPYGSLRKALSVQPRKNAEGYVIRYIDHDILVKIKYESYVSLHKIVTGLNERVVWENLAANTLEDLLSNVPDEFHSWVLDVSRQLQEQFNRVNVTVVSNWGFTESLAHDRGKFARNICLLDPHIKASLFRILDGRPYDDILWKHLRPVGETFMTNQGAAA